ncbi:hypothetical protein GCM10027174_38980 [Salinifilum aidingensis]
MSGRITKIEFEIQTATEDRASDTFDAAPGVDHAENRVFLGMGGREFTCSTEDDDFRAGATDLFVFGGDANVINPDINDPGEMELEDIHNYPMYLRFHRFSDQSDEWCVERAEITVHTVNQDEAYRREVLDGDGLQWLGSRSGEVLHLR